ncbi:MAG: YitT family protein [Oscillospiraceae bacterium]|nr:YitT family protein [Oscillospiraceae bacterium]
MKPKYSFKTFALDLLFDFIGCTLYAAGINCFIIPQDFASGGVSGIALIITYLTGLPNGTITFILNIPLIIFSFKILGHMFLLKSVKTLAILTLCIDVLTQPLPHYTGDPILAAICAGLCIGAGLGIVYMRGTSTGGSDFITLSVRKLKPHMSVGTITSTIDYIILGASIVFLGNVDAALYGCVAMFVSATVLDKIMYGGNKGKMMLIVTEKGEEVANSIFATTERGVTIADVRGAYSGNPKQLVISAMSKHELPKARKAAHLADEMAFTMITNTDEVFGEGFIDPRED